MQNVPTMYDFAKILKNINILLAKIFIFTAEKKQQKQTNKTQQTNKKQLSILHGQVFVINK